MHYVCFRMFTKLRMFYIRMFDILFTYITYVFVCFRGGRPWVRACVRTCVLLARYMRTHWTKFHQTLVDDVVEATDEDCWRSMGQGQGHSKVKYLSDLLRRAEASTPTLWRRSIVSVVLSLFQSSPRWLCICLGWFVCPSVIRILDKF